MPLTYGAAGRLLTWTNGLRARLEGSSEINPIAITASTQSIATRFVFLGLS